MKQIALIIIGAMVAIGGIGWWQFGTSSQAMEETEMNMMEKTDDMTMKMTKTAVFAGGCFWCTESDFEKVHGVIEAVSGYTGGHDRNPSYHDVSNGGTGHVEAVKVIYDPALVRYEDLLDYFWRHVDPTFSVTSSFSVEVGI